MRKAALGILLFVNINIQAQDNSIIAQIMGSKDADYVSSFFNSTIDLELPDSKGVYSLNQAKLLYTEFLKNQPDLVYVKKHNGGGSNKPKFEIGTLKSNKLTFRTYLLYNLVQEKPQIIELRVQTED